MTLLADLSNLINLRLGRKKTKLEIQKLEQEFRVVQQISFADVQCYDPKVSKLVRTVKEGSSSRLVGRGAAKKKAAPKFMTSKQGKRATTKKSTQRRTRSK
jgi:hypothetical protein